MDNLNRQYASVDLVKMIAAMLIVIMHINFNGNIVMETLKQYVSRLGVPYFMIASGFFLGINLNKESNQLLVLKNFLKRVLLLFILWSAIYAPYNLYTLFENSNNIETTIQVYFHNLLFLAPSFLWYLMAIAVASIPFCILYKKYLFELFIVSFILYIIGTIGNSYVNIINFVDFQAYLDVFLTTRNGVFFAPLFLCMGGIFSQSIIKALENKKVILMLLISYALFCLEVYFVREQISNDQDSSMFFTMPLVSLFLFKISLNNWHHKGIYFFRKVSTGIYVSQFGFIIVYTKFFNNFEINNFNGILVYIATIITATLMTFYIMKTRNIYLMKLI